MTIEHNPNDPVVAKRCVDKLLALWELMIAVDPSWSLSDIMDEVTGDHLAGPNNIELEALLDKSLVEARSRIN